MKKRSVVIFSVLFLVLLLPFAFAEDNTTGFSAQNGYDWLYDQINSDGSVNSEVTQTALAVMALDTQSYDTTDSQSWLTSQLSTDYCYPSSSCTTTDTAFAVLALNQLQSDGDFDSINSWYQSALSASDLSGEWDLEVVTSATGSCIVSYELEDTLQEIEIAVEEGVFTDCGNTHFLDLDSCLQPGLISANPGIVLTVDCSTLEGSVVLTHLYQSSSTFYLLANENAADAEFQVNNGCFGKSSGSSCDLDSTLYSNWALGKLGSSINTLVYLKENYDDTNPSRVALMYLVTKDTSYLDTLASLQKSDGSFDRDSYTTALAILALSDTTTYSTNIEDAKSYLREEQSTDGDWGGSVQTTAMVLYAAFQDESVTPGISTGTDDGIDSSSECETNADCELLYGSDYSCDAGSCSYSLSTGACQTDADCDTGEVCLDDGCVASDCDYGQYCTSGKSCCDYSAGYNENVYNCPSDCSCGDGICDDIETDSSSGDEYYCAEDCGGEDTSSSDDSSDTSSTTTSTSSDGGSSWILYVVLFLVFIGLGVGGYFAYKKGMLDTILSKFKKGGKGSSGFTQSSSSYNPFTSKLAPQQAPQQRSPFGAPPQQPKRPF